MGMIFSSVAVVIGGFGVLVGAVVVGVSGLVVVGIAAVCLVEVLERSAASAVVIFAFV